MRKSKKLLVGCSLAASSLVISGCGNSEVVSNEDLSIASINSSADEKTLVDLVEAWEESTGEVCDPYELYLGTSRAQEGVLCDTSSSFLWIFPSASEVKLELNDRDHSAQKFSEISNKDPRPNLVGPNWLVSVREDENWGLQVSADDVHKKMQDKLGGVFVVASDSE